MKAVNLSNVKEAGSNRLEAGGYVCKYTNVEDVADRSYLLMEFDIAEGPHKDHFKELEESAGFWGGKCYRSYKDAALPMFKRMCTAVTKSNPGYIFDGGQQNSDESTLKGKLVGIVLKEEEYEKNNGDIGTRLVVSYECPVEDIRNGKFKVPAPKKLEKPVQAAVPSEEFLTVSDADMAEVPFN